MYINARLWICINLPSNFALAPSMSRSLKSYIFTLKSSFEKIKILVVYKHLSKYQFRLFKIQQFQNSVHCKNLMKIDILLELFAGRVA